ncbi:MAG: flagellar biosynthetic protein FliR [Planctomycetota bacterium]
MPPLPGNFDPNALWEMASLAGVPQQFALVAFRLMGLMMIAPMLGSDRIPRPVKLYLAVAMTLSLAVGGGLPVSGELPQEPWRLAAGIVGELGFGLLAGLMLSLAFNAARWAGGVAGQQMGFNLAGAIDARSDVGGNPLGDLYFILTLFIFLSLDGHHAMLLGLRDSFDHVPPLSFAVDAATLDLLVEALLACATLALRIAAPICCSMLVVDLALGMLGKTIPALNLLSVGLSLRALVGLTIVITGLAATAYLLNGALDEGLDLATRLWTQT